MLKKGHFPLFRGIFRFFRSSKNSVSATSFFDSEFDNPFDDLEYQKYSIDFFVFVKREYSKIIGSKTNSN